MSSDYASSVDEFIGQEFLTWLWYRSDTSPDSFVTEDGEGFTVSMEQRIIVQGGVGDEKETASVSGAFSSLSEARFGLSMGKKVVRALLHIEKDSMVYQFVVKADDFTLSSVKTPKAAKDSLSEEDDPESIFLEKLFLLENCADFLDTIFTVFIKLRLSREWVQEVQEMHKWMTESV